MYRVLFLISLLALAVRAENTPRYAASDRSITIEQWSGRGSVATVWAVLPSKIVVYRIEGSSRDELVCEVTITKKQQEKIRRLVASIPTKSRGRVWSGGGFDGIMLRFSFSADGSLRDDRIEIENHWRPEFADLIAAVSDQMPPESKITFKEKLEHCGPARAIPTESISVKEYYRMP